MRNSAAQGRPQEIQATKALPAVATTPVGAGGRMAGPRLVAAAHQRQAARPVAGRCAHARVPGDHLPMGLPSRPLRERWARCLPRGHRRRRRHGGRRTSRFPIPGRVPISERPPRPTAGERVRPLGGDSVIGVGCNLHTEVERDRGFLMARVVPDKTAGESVGAQLDMFSPLPAGARASASRTTTAPSSPTTKGCATGWAWPRTSPTRTPAGSGKQREPQRHDPPVSAQTLRDTDGHGKGGQEIVDEINNRPMRVLGYRTPAEAFADELLELQDQQGCCTSK